MMVLLMNIVDGTSCFDIKFPYKVDVKWIGTTIDSQKTSPNRRKHLMRLMMILIFVEILLTTILLTFQKLSN
jgi:hypothetical protein